MYYKVVKDKQVLDVLDHLVYARHIEKTDVMVACVRSAAQAILSSDGERFWHVRGLYYLPGYEVCELVEISQSEYERLTAQPIIPS